MEETVKTDSETVKKEVAVKTDDSATQETKDLPWGKDPRFKDDLEAVKIGKSIKSLMAANELSDVEDLKDLIESGKKVHGKKVDLENLDEIMEDSKTLKRYQQYWKQQEDLNKQNAEAPEETIARLKAERDEVISRVSKKEMSEREAKEAKQSVQFYESEVSTLLESAPMSKSEKEFLAWSLGVGNECNEIQITDKKAIRKVLNDGVKKYDNLVKTIKEEAVKDYLAGKKGIPSVPSTDGAVATINIEPPKGLKNLRKAFQDSMRGSQ